MQQKAQRTTVQHTAAVIIQPVRLMMRFDNEDDEDGKASPDDDDDDDVKKIADVVHWSPGGTVIVLVRHVTQIMATTPC